MDWKGACDNFAEEIDQMTQHLLSKDGVLKNIKQYGLSLFNMGQNIAICYLVMAIKRWEKYDKATSGQKSNSFISDMRTLLDLFVYEYITDVWKGSGDSYLSKKLNEPFDVMCKKVSESDWNQTIDKLYDENQFRFGKFTKDKLSILTYYFSAIRDKKIVVDKNTVVHIDHIIPKAQFTDNTDQEHREFMDSMYNYALLPPDLNKEKSDWVNYLSESDKKSICLLEDLDESQLSQITAAANMPVLKRMRSVVPADIKQKRKQYVDCYGCWSIH